MSFRLIAADLDGTLRPEGKPFTGRVRSAVQAARKKGVHVVMATGRMFRTAEWFARDLGLVGPIICDHGATIRDLDTNAILMEKRMPLDLTRQIIRQIRESTTAVVCIDGEFLVKELTENAATFAGSHAKEHLHCVADLGNSLSAGPQKIVLIGEPKVMSELFVELEPRFRGLLQVVQSFPRYVELTHRDVSKGMAVEWLAKRYGLTRDEVIAIGDQDNDISMIQWAGLGLAMGNAIERVKAVAHHVAPSVDDDGVADVIERYVLNGSFES